MQNASAISPVGERQRAPLAWARASGGLFGVLLLASLAGTAWSGYRARQAEELYESEARRSATFARVREVTGRPLPSTTLASTNGAVVRIDTVAKAGSAALWIFASTDCLYCLAEVEQWKDLAARHPSLRIVGIATGDRRDLVKTFVESERPPFPVVYDSAGTIRTALGLPASGTIRLFARDGRVVLADYGTKPAGLSVVDQVKLLLVQ